MRGPAAVAVLAALAAAPAAADVVSLQNGVRLTGIVRASTDEELTVQVSEEGFIVLATDEVLKVERRGQAENERIRESWAAQARRDKEFERRDQEEERLARERREKRRDLEAAAPPSPLQPVTIQVVVVQQAFSPPPVLVHSVSFERPRRRGRFADRSTPFPTTTSRGLLPPPWSVPRDIPLILGPSLAGGR